MPAVFDPLFARWLTQHGDPHEQGVNVLKFSHPAFGDRYVSDYGDDFTATLDGVEFTAEPLGFVIDLASDSISTEQRVQIRLDNANGLVTQELAALTPDDLLIEIEVTYLAYLESKRDAPAYDPVELLCSTVRATRLAVEIEAGAGQFPNVMAGTRYTMDAFPTMGFL